MKNGAVLLGLCAELVATVALSAPKALAADSSSPTQPTTQPQADVPGLEKWVVRPSPASQDPLEYRLLPDLVEQTPGNAVQLYLEATRFWPGAKTSGEVLYPENNKFDYLETPIDQFPRQDAEKLLDAYGDTLAFVDRAARRESAVWDDDWPDPKLGAKSLAYRDDLRHAANLLSFRARFEISQGDWSAAIYTLQTSFSMAKQFGSAPLMIHAIDEAGFAEIPLMTALPEWIKRGDSPNLYWALSNLPHPFVELGPVARSVRIPIGETPLDKAIRDELPREEWHQVVVEMIGRLQESRPLFRRDPATLEAQASQTISSTYARARQYLLSGGTPKEQVEAMTPDQAVGTYFCREARAASDELWKCWGLPYPQAQEQMLHSWKALGSDQPPLMENPLFQADQVEVRLFGGTQRPDFDIPMLLRWRYLLSTADREIAMLQTVEALRDYAARHDGQPPDRLDQITDLPAPLDPVTGKPFDYAARGQTVILQALTPWWPRTGWRVELTFAK
jgi:hypothetical protein